MYKMETLTSLIFVSQFSQELHVFVVESLNCEYIISNGDCIVVIDRKLYLLQLFICVIIHLLSVITLKFMSSCLEYNLS